MLLKSVGLKKGRRYKRFVNMWAHFNNMRFWFDRNILNLNTPWPSDLLPLSYQIQGTLTKNNCIKSFVIERNMRLKRKGQKFVSSVCKSSTFFSGCLIPGGAYLETLRTNHSILGRVLPKWVIWLVDLFHTATQRGHSKPYQFIEKDSGQTKKILRFFSLLD